MSIEKNIERIADTLEALEGIANVLFLKHAPVPAPVEPEPEPEPAPLPVKPKRKRRTKKQIEEDAAAAPQPEPVPAGESTPTEADQAEPVPEPTAEPSPLGEIMTSDDLNTRLMDLAKGGSPEVVNAIFAVLKQVGADNTSMVPETRRAWVLDNAQKAVAAGA